MATTPNYLKLRYSHTCDIGSVYYTAGFINTLILDSLLGKPEYVDEIEEFQNGDGVDIPTFQRLIKVYQFQTYAPENIVDTLKFMQLHDTITLEYTNGLYSSQIRNVKVSAEWDTDNNDCMALVTVKFQQDDQVNKNLCCISM